MIQSIMLAAMGFIAASLMAVLVAPAFWSRAVRLTNQRLRHALPLSEQEIRADKDLLRAEYALKVHQLEREIDQARLAAHRQQIEINRRDIEIRRTSEDLSRSEAGLSEHRNARTVLEQTVGERIPILERSLADARAVLETRDIAINDLQSTADRQAAALEDGRAILTQRALEVQRLQALFQEAHAQTRERRADGTGGGDSLVLRAEIESLKARLAERGAVLERLQSEAAARPRGATVADYSELQDENDPALLRGRIAEQASELRQLKRDLEGAKEATATGVLPPEAAVTASHVRQMDVRLRAQADEIARLRAETEATTRAGDPAANAMIRESRVWLKARSQRLEGDLERERDVSGRLKAELAAANERLARQASQFRDELRRVGSRPSQPARDILINNGIRRALDPPTVASAPPAPTATRRPSISARARELQRALQGHFGEPQPDAATSAALTAASTGAELAITVEAPNAGDGGQSITPISANLSDSESQNNDASPRARLLERLKTYEQA